MKFFIRGLLPALVLLMVPRNALAQENIAMADLPAGTMVAGPDYRFRLSAERAGKAAIASAGMLERLFAPAGRPYWARRQPDTVFAIGGVEIIAEALRERMPVAAGGGGRAAHLFDRLSAVGIKAGLALSDEDDLSLGFAAKNDKRPAPAILAGRKAIDGHGIIADCTWSHGAHLQMSLAWRADRGASRGGMNRVLELAQGAAPSEQGFGLTLRYLVAGAEMLRSTTLGIAARDGRIAADDVAALGSVRRHHAQTALFLTAAF